MSAEHSLDKVDQCLEEMSNFCYMHKTYFHYVSSLIYRQ